MYTMRIITKYTKLDSTAAIEEYAKEKIGALDKLVRRYEAEGEIEARVELARTTRHHKKGAVFYAEITLPLPGKTLRAEDEDFDVRVAVDRVRDKMKREIGKYKDTER